MKKLLLLLFFLPIVFGEYYADIELFVDSSGFVNIKGITNFPSFISGNNFTLKNKELWTLNLSYEDIFSDYIYIAHLPSGAIIKNIIAPNAMSITQDDKGLMIMGIGSNESFKLVINYEIEKENKNNMLLFFGSIFIIIIFIILSSTYYFFNKYKNNKIKIDYSILTERQGIIMKILVKKKVMTQKELEQLKLMPKSSLSRNIVSLEKKDLIIKNKKGITNQIKLNSHSVPFNSGK